MSECMTVTDNHKQSFLTTLVVTNFYPVDCRQGIKSVRSDLLNIIKILGNLGKV